MCVDSYTGFYLSIYMESYLDIYMNNDTDTDYILHWLSYIYFTGHILHLLSYIDSTGHIRAIIGNIAFIAFLYIWIH